MKVLITGASGFVGGYLVDELYSRGYEIKAVVRKTSKVDQFKNKVELVYADLEKIETVEPHLQDVDYVIHSAAITKAINAAEYYKYNTQPTLKLAAG